MLNVFIETSGKAHPSDKGPYVVIAAMIQSENLEKLKFGIQELKLLSFGSYGAGSRLKTNDIVHGNGIFRNITMEKRSELLDRMIKILEMSEAQIVFSVINSKTTTNRSPEYITLGFEEKALHELILRVYLASRRFSDSDIRFILDSPQWNHDSHLSEGVRKLIFDLFKQMQPLGLINYKDVPPPIFSNSTVEPFIEIANLIAYLVRNNYYKTKRQYSYSFIKNYRAVQSKIYNGFADGDPRAGIFEL